MRIEKYRPGKHRSLVILGLVAALLMLGCGGADTSTDSAPAPAAGLTDSADPAGKTKFTVAWSIYVGWMSWDCAGTSEILKKWADKYDIEIELVRMDYIPSVEAYVAEQVDAL